MTTKTAPQAAYYASSGESEAPGQDTAQEECLYCGAPYTPKRDDQKFCGAAHRVKFYTRRQERGIEAVEALFVWRIRREPGAFNRLTRMVDRWRREDKKARQGK